MSYLLALTGSIGMGKSTAAGIFTQHGVPVWDADAAVHDLYLPGAAGTKVVEALVPTAVGAAGVDRAALREEMKADETLLPRLQEHIHPLVAADRADFIAQRDEAVLAFDIPLVFELGNEGDFDGVAVVTTEESLQRQRVLAREGMTAETLEFILSKQLSDAEKRKKADFLIDSTSLATAERDIKAILAKIGAPDA
ncbi:MAG: dephospho-CoA kinase [Pseudomonadota bacterium]